MRVVEISASVFEKIPSLILISGRAEIGVPKLPEIQAYLEQSWNKLGAQIGAEGPKAHALIGAWRENLKRVGVPVKDCPISIEAIAKRAARGGMPFTINSIVDLYNAISMDQALPLGAYDCRALTGPLQLRLSKGNERFNALGSQQSELTVPDEIVYADTQTVLTRHFLWRQSEKAKITSDTRECIFVCELLAEMGQVLVETVKSLIETRFTTLLGAKIIDLQVSQRAVA